MVTALVVGMTKTNQNKYQDRCLMCENHPGEHKFPDEQIDTLQQQRDEARAQVADERAMREQALLLLHKAEAQVADLLAVVLKTREYMAVNSPANGWANSLRLDINATIAAAEGRQS